MTRSKDSEGQPLALKLSWYILPIVSSMVLEGRRRVSLASTSAPFSWSSRLDNAAIGSRTGRALAVGFLGARFGAIMDSIGQ